MLRKVRVYGRLAEFLGRNSFEAEVNSAAEAIRFLLANFPQLEKHMATQYYRVMLGNETISKDDLHIKSGNKDIRIVPVFVGAGGGGGQGMSIGMIIAGIALIALSIVSFGSSAAFAGILSAGGAKAGGSMLLFAVGASLAVTGTAMLLTPTPSIMAPTIGGYGSTTRDSEIDPQKSYSFSGIQNTSTIGTPCPVCYGETVIGSLVISAGLDTDQT